MKKRLITIVLLLMPLWCMAADHQIKYVDTKSGYYYIYVSDNESPRMMSTNKGELVGYSSEMLVLKRDGYYVMYNQTGRMLGSVSTGRSGEVVSVAKNCLMTKKDGYLITWNDKGRKIKEESIRR